MREKYNLLVLTTIKQTIIDSKVGKNVVIPKVQGVANPDTVLEKDDILVLFGDNKDIQAFLKKG
jgi:trk system potassium uptake protein TrkA